MDRLARHSSGRRITDIAVGASRFRWCGLQPGRRLRDVAPARREAESALADLRAPGSRWRHERDRHRGGILRRSHAARPAAAHHSVRACLFETFLLSVGGAILVVLLERERAELMHKTAAQVDALTGVANRRAFTEHALQSLADSQRDDAPLSLVFFDLDHFKSINDSNGHAVGDHVLRRFADVAGRYLRPDDIIGRIGGEEFAVILPCISPGAAYVIADRIRGAFSESCRNLDALSLNVTVSAGVAAAHAWSSFDSMMQAGDEALYRAKTRGRNRVEHGDQMSDDRVGRTAHHPIFDG
jgi:diguanylate cyclase (GGDEF)-like protein